uniref:Uncharacterized protein n=1 Tax=Arundo donax TaxID=35708 RepID=A0A0A8XV44_ARUDO
MRLLHAPRAFASAGAAAAAAAPAPASQPQGMLGPVVDIIGLFISVVITSTSMNRWDIHIICSGPWLMLWEYKLALVQEYEFVMNSVI